MVDNYKVWKTPALEPVEMSQVGNILQVMQVLPLISSCNEIVTDVIALILSA